MKSWVYYIIGAGVLLIILSVLYRPVYSENDLVYYPGTFHSIERYESRGRSVSYEVYLNEYNRSFKIAADHVDCFDYGKFDQRMHPGDSLIIGMTEGIPVIGKEFVAYLKSRRRNFFDLECRNNGNSLIASFLSLIIMAFFGWLAFYIIKKVKNRENVK